MIRSDYHIAPADTTREDWSQCRLLLELNRHFFHYLLLEGDHTVVALKYYQLAPSPEKSIAELLEDVIEADELLQKNIPVSVMAYNLPEQALVPEVYHEEDINRDVIRLVHGDLHKEITLAEKIRHTEMVNVYQVPARLHRLMEHRFHPARYRHYYTLWIEWMLQQGGEKTDCLHVVFYPHEIQALLVQNGNIQLVQAFAYETTEDAAYHLLNIYYRNGLSTTGFPMKVGGMVATDSALFEELLKYFMLVQTETPPEELQLAEDFGQFPSHFFSPVLKMAVCE